ncbi:MAG: erythromycin esterase family protein [Cyclobacteriaceae bacterium]
MKYLKHIFIIYLVLLCSKANAQIDEAFLKENLIQIQSLKENDWSFLNNELANREIVMLGEQGHGDGSTFIAKTEIIKYLHEEMGFAVIVFESGLMDAFRVWKKIEDGNKTLEVFDSGIFPVWTKSEQVQELFKYILEQSKTDNPLVVAGFDMQPTGQLMTQQKRTEELNAYLSKIEKYRSEDYPMLNAAFSNMRALIMKGLDNQKFEALSAEFQKLRKVILENDKSEEGLIMSRGLDNFLSTVIFYAKGNMRDPSSTPNVFNIRDKEMADNLKFLNEEVYPGKKVVIWGANTHLGYARGLLKEYNDQPIVAREMVPMGHYLKMEYIDNIYSLAFTSSKGSRSSLRSGVSELEKAKEETLEHQISQLDYDYAFLSTKNLPNETFTSRIYGHREMNGNWKHMCDGIFYIDTMLPSDIEK